MKIETIGIRNEYSIYIDGRKVMDIQDATNAYPFLLKTGKFKEVISDSLTHGISLLQSKGEVKPLVFHTAQVAGAVKAAAGEARAGALAGTDSCATSGSP